MASLKMASLRSLARRIGGESGAELIEMAMVTPILLMILAGIFDFGFLFRSWEVVTNAAREGARVGVLPSYSCESGSADVETRVDAYMAASGIGGFASYNVTMDTGDVEIDEDKNFKACLVRVELDQELPSLSVIGRMFGGTFGTIKVAGAAVMRTEDQASSE